MFHEIIKNPDICERGYKLRRRKYWQLWQSKRRVNRLNVSPWWTILLHQSSLNLLLPDGAAAIEGFQALHDSCTDTRPMAESFPSNDMVICYPYSHGG